MPDRILRGVIGIVTEVLTPFKACVEFYLGQSHEKAMMKKEKFVYNGQQCLNDEYNFCGILQIGMHVTFNAHGFDPKNPSLWAGDDFGWYIILGWCVEEENSMLIRYKSGIVNAQASISSLGVKRQGTLCYEMENGRTHNILFLGSKVYMYGRRLKTKASLRSQLELDDTLCCDAVPCDPRQNKHGCDWFATAVWRGHKPKNPNLDKKIELTNAASVLRLLRSITNNTRTVFLEGQGQIVKVLSHEFGLALLRLRTTQWCTVVFHRSVCFIRGLCLSKVHLKKFFKEGDQVRIVCTSSHDQLPVKYVASQISCDVGGRLKKRVLRLKKWRRTCKPKPKVVRRTSNTSVRRPS